MERLSLVGKRVEADFRADFFEYGEMHGGARTQNRS
jgi:hypothetical protein